ncbi:hypothetical protein Q8F55_002811 [Vanrija albida]|uniref:Uncharacterized protein n=1 Tax=Vanrija albida TaxID=181172 RepID=A0ABR3QBV9_9TREE
MVDTRFHDPASCLKAIYTVFTSPHHAPMPNHLPTLIVTPHGQPSQVLYTYLHTEENKVNYLLTPSPQGDLCVAKLFPPSRQGATSSSSLPTMQANKHNVVRCEASRDLKWTIENTGVMSPTYKIVNQDETPLYQISKPNPHADWWTMFYFKYAGHQIPPRRIEFGKIAKNPPEKGGGTRITVTGRNEDEKQVWQTLGVGNEDCVEWVIVCACLNLLDDQILQAAERKQTGAGPASTAPSRSPVAASAPMRGPAATAPPPRSPAATRPVRPQVRPPNGSYQGGPRSAGGHMGPGIASTGPGIASTGPPRGIASTGPGIASTGPPGGYHQAPPPQQRLPPNGMPPNGMPPQGRAPMPPQGYDPRMQGSPRGSPVMQRPPPQTAGRRF